MLIDGAGTSVVIEDLAFTENESKAFGTSIFIQGGTNWSIQRSKFQEIHVKIACGAVYDTGHARLPSAILHLQIAVQVSIVVPSTRSVVSL